MVQLRKIILPLAFAGMALTFAGCPGKRNANAPAQSKSSQTQLWKKFDTPPGADPSVKAEEGGAGFEKIAEAQGFKTYVVQPDEMKYFGDANAKTGGEIRTIVTRFLISFRPIGYGQNAQYAENSWLRSMCYEGLITTHPITQEYMPSLATHWKISDDKLTYTFRIDPNARFWNGKPVTSKDVVATWKLLMDESLLQPSNILTYGKFEEPKAISKYIVEVKCKTLNWRNLLYFGGMAILSEEEIGKMTGKEFIERFSYDMPVGTGEYLVLKDDIKKGESYTFTRRDDYWAKEYPASKYAGNFDRITCEVVKDNPTLEYEKFKKGEQDFFIVTGITTEKWVNDTSYDALSKGWITKRRVFTQGAMGTQGYAFNMRKAPFDDIRVRKAFNYLLNRESIISKLLYNEYVLSNSQYANTPCENPNNEKIQYNPEMGMKLLEEAGWKNKNSNGILTKNGKPFIVEMAIPQAIEKFVTPYQEELKKAGIDLQVRIQDQSTLWKNMMERNFSICRINWGGLNIPNPETSLSSALADKNDNNNLEGFKNKRVDELLAMYDTAYSRSAQVAIVQEIDKITQDTYKNVLEWSPKGLRIMVWNKFGMPEYVYPRTTRSGDQHLAIFSLWWYDEAKAQALDEAKKSGKELPKPPLVVDYWKGFSR